MKTKTLEPEPSKLLSMYENAHLVKIEKEWNAGYGAAMYVVEKCRCKTHSAAIKYYQKEFDKYVFEPHERTIINTEFMGSNFKRIMKVQIEYHQDMLKLEGDKITKRPTR